MPQGLAGAIATAVRRQPGVARLSGGPGGIGTYDPAGRVLGVRVNSDGVELHLVVEWVASLPHLADEVRAAIRPLVGDRPVAVFLEDIEGPI